jgi:hypothetical protein
MNIDVDSLQLVCQFPFANNYETRDINLEISKLFCVRRNSFWSGYIEEKITKKYGYGSATIKFIAITLPEDIFVSFNYNNLGEYLLFISKKDKVFEYRNYNNQAWIKPEYFRSFEGLNALSTIEKFCNGEITENLHEVKEGFAFENFSSHSRNS